MSRVASSNRTFWIDYLKAFAVVLMLFGHCLLNWNPLMYIYQSVGATLYVFGEQCSLWQHVVYNLVRIVCGISGSIVVIGIFHNLRELMSNSRLNAWMETIAKYSMSIYVSSVYIFNAFLRNMRNLDYNILRNIGQTVVILCGSVLLSHLLFSNKITKSLFFGIFEKNKKEKV